MRVEKHSGFTNARSWLADVREHADPHLTCILVGNKVDLCESDSNGKRREVPTEEAELWAKEEGLLFVEASAKSGQNVEDAFVQAASDILSKIRRGVFDDDRVSGGMSVVTRITIFTQLTFVSVSSFNSVADFSTSLFLVSGRQVIKAKW